MSFNPSQLVVKPPPAVYPPVSYPPPAQAPHITAAHSISAVSARPTTLPRSSCPSVCLGASQPYILHYPTYPHGTQLRHTINIPMPLFVIRTCPLSPCSWTTLIIRSSPLQLIIPCGSATTSTLDRRSAIRRLRLAAWTTSEVERQTSRCSQQSQHPDPSWRQYWDWVFANGRNTRTALQVSHQIRIHVDGSQFDTNSLKSTALGLKESTSRVNVRQKAMSDTAEAPQSCATDESSH